MFLFRCSILYEVTRQRRSNFRRHGCSAQGRGGLGRRAKRANCGVSDYPYYREVTSQQGSRHSGRANSRAASRRATGGTSMRVHVGFSNTRGFRGRATRRTVHTGLRRRTKRVARHERANRRTKWRQAYRTTRRAVEPARRRATRRCQGVRQTGGHPYVLGKVRHRQRRRARHGACDDGRYAFCLERLERGVSPP